MNLKPLKVNVWIGTLNYNSYWSPEAISIFKAKTNIDELPLFIDIEEKFEFLNRFYFPNQMLSLDRIYFETFQTHFSETRLFGDSSFRSFDHSKSRFSGNLIF